GERVSLHSITPRSWVALAYMIMFGSIIAFSAYTWLLRVSTAARVGTHAYVNPIIAVALGWAAGGETVTARMLVGAAIVLAIVLHLRFRGRSFLQRVNAAADFVIAAAGAQLVQLFRLRALHRLVNVQNFRRRFLDGELVHADDDLLAVLHRTLVLVAGLGDFF